MAEMCPVCMADNIINKHFLGLLAFFLSFSLLYNHVGIIVELNQEEASIIYLNLCDQKKKKRLIHDQCILKRLKKKIQC